MSSNIYKPFSVEARSLSPSTTLHSVEREYTKPMFIMKRSEIFPTAYMMIHVIRVLCLYADDINKQQKRMKISTNKLFLPHAAMALPPGA